MAHAQGAPSAPIVTGVASTAPNGTYGQGRQINVSVSFNKTVVYTGEAPVLHLNVSGLSRAAPYAEGNSSNALTFTYAVQAGDLTDDLEYYNTTALHGRITDGARNEANLTLPAPGSTGSLSDSGDILVDWAAPPMIAAQHVEDNRGGFDALQGNLYVEAFRMDNRTYAVVGTWDDGAQLVRLHENGTMTAAGSAHFPDGYLTLRRSHAVVPVASGDAWYALAVSYDNDGVQLIRISEDGALSPADSLADNSTLNFDGARGADALVVGGHPHAIVTGYNDDAVQLVRINGDGTLEARGSLADNGTLALQKPIAVDAFDLGGHPHALVSGRYDHGVQLVRINGDGTLEARGSLIDNSSTVLRQPHGIEAFDLGGEPHALVAGFEEDGVQLVRINGDGTLEARGSATDNSVGGAFDKLDTPFSISVFRSASGGTYAAVASFDDHGVQLIRVRGDGTLLPAGSASNGGDWRLYQANSIDAFSLGGGTYAISTSYQTAGGLQLMRLSPASAASVSTTAADGSYGPGSEIDLWRPRHCRPVRRRCPGGRATRAAAQLGRGRVP